MNLFSRSILLGAALILACVAAGPAPLSAQSAPAAGDGLSVARELLPVEIGRAANGPVSYQVYATAALNATEKGQRIQFVTREAGGGRSATSYTVVNTGKSKSLGQLADILGGGMRRFSAGGATMGQEFGKVGDVRYGGELRLVAVDADSLRFEYNPPTSRPVTFTRADAAAFAGILDGRFGQTALEGLDDACPSSAESETSNEPQ